jgi:hypothetical protein
MLRTKFTIVLQRPLDDSLQIREQVGIQPHTGDGRPIQNGLEHQCNRIADAVDSPIPRESFTATSSQRRFLSRTGVRRRFSIDAQIKLGLDLQRFACKHVPEGFAPPAVPSR